MTSPDEYLVPLSPDNASVLFIDNQTALMLGTQSIDTTLLRTNTEGLAKLAALYALPVVLTTTGGGEHGPSGPLIPNEAALQRLVQMGATPTTVQSVAGELQNASAVQDLAASKTRQPDLMEWFGRYTPAPALIGMSMRR